MGRRIQVRVRGGLAGLAGVLGLGLVTASLLATPSFAATPGSGAAPGGVATSGGVAVPGSSAPSPAVTTTGNPTLTGTGAPSPTLTSPTTTSCRPVSSRPTAPTGTVVSSFDFEDGTTQGWSGSGGATVAVSTDLADGGTHSLRVGGLTGTDTVEVPLNTLPNFGWYQVTARVRVRSPQPSAKVVLRPVAYGGAVVPGSALVGADGWTTVRASFQASTLYIDDICNGTMTGTQLPGPARVQLALDVVACGQVIDRPATVYLDTVQVTSLGWATTMTPTTVPPSTVAPSPTGCVTPPPATCQVSYQVQSRWAGGYVAAVQVRNLTATALPDWTLRWTFPDDETVGAMWGATASQTGRTVTADSPPWAPLAAGGTAALGFVGAAAGTPGIPTDLTLNGQACTT